MKHSSFLGLSFIVMLAMLLPATLRAREFKQGVGRIEVNMSDDVPSDSLIVFVVANDFFPDYQKSQPDTLENRGKGHFVGDIPLDLTEKLCLLKITDDKEHTRAYGLVPLAQDNTLKLEVGYDKANGSLTVSPSDLEIVATPNQIEHSFAVLFGTVIGDYIVGGIYSPFPYPERIEAAGANAWREALAQMDSVFDPQIYELKGIGQLDKHKLFAPATWAKKVGMTDAQRKMLREHMQWFIYPQYYLRYEAIRKHLVPDSDPATPPLDYYRHFINNVDFNALIDYTFIQSPYDLLKEMLINIPVGIEPIGERNVAEWEADTKKRLGQVVDTIPDIMLDMLAAVSYDIQLVDDKKPLSDVQKANIKAGFGNDLGKMVLERNSRLEKKLSAPNEP